VCRTVRSARSAVSSASRVQPSAAISFARTARRGALTLASPLAHSSFSIFRAASASSWRPCAYRASANGTAVSPSELCSPIAVSTSQLSRSARSAATASPAESSIRPRLRFAHCDM
jgi:hypothetical protein